MGLLDRLDERNGGAPWPPSACDTFRCLAFVTQDSFAACFEPSVVGQFAGAQELLLLSGHLCGPLIPQ